MCPACLTTMVIAALGATGAGAAVTALVRGRRSADRPATEPENENENENENEDEIRTLEDRHEHYEAHRHA